MPVELILPNLPAGYAAEAKRKGDPGPLKVEAVGFYTTEDGDALLRRLEVVSDLLGKLPIEARVPESKVEHLLAFIKRDRSAVVYINEVKFIASVRSKSTLAAGDPVRDDDIADIIKIAPEGVSIPADAAVIILLSAGWRKGFFFDYRPISPEGSVPNQYDLEVLLAKMFVQIAFQDRIKISEDEWNEFLSQKWFPFISIGVSKIRTMITHVQNKWAIDDLLDEILAEVVRRLPLIRGSVANNAVFEGHREIISKGLDHFESRDYMSATAVLYPRIEGVLRSQHARVAPGVSASQTALASSAVADPKNIRHDQSLLLPTKFRQFLETVYFAHFDPASVQDVSRNTVSHGVAPEKEMSLKAALLAVLILEQIAMLAG